MRKMNYSELEGNDIIIVKGRIVYSKLFNVIEGELLKLENERRKSTFKKNSPYITITIRNPEILQVNDEMTKNEMVIQSRIYNSKKDPNLKLLTFEPSTNKPATIAILDKETRTATEIIPKGELAKGTEVTLYFRPHKNRETNAKTVVLDIITVDEMPTFITKESNFKTTLERIGITYKPLDEETRENGYKKMKEIYENDSVIEITDEESETHEEHIDMNKDIHTITNPNVQNVQNPQNIPTMQTPQTINDIQNMQNVQNPNIQNFNAQARQPYPAEMPTETNEGIKINDYLNANAWICPNCGKTVSGNINVCDMCGTGRIPR